MEDKRPLYHYTSQEGLRGILKTNKLWMTNILYLTDGSEFLYTIGLVFSELMKHKKNVPKNELPRYDFIEQILINLLSSKSMNGYIFSLSKNGNDLNQWRGYCPSMGGFSIGFDKERLTTMIKEYEGYRIPEECIYTLKKQKEIIKPIFQHLDDELLPSSDEIIFNFTNLFFSGKGLYFKDKSFRYEKEYRIVYFGKSDKLEHREGRSMIIPYVEFPPVDSDNKLPISKIIVGPTPHLELSKLSIESLLKTIGYENVEKMVEISKIPYQSW